MEENTTLLQELTKLFNNQALFWTMVLFFLEMTKPYEFLFVKVGNSILRRAFNALSCLATVFIVLLIVAKFDSLKNNIHWVSNGVLFLLLAFYWYRNYKLTHSGRKPKHNQLKYKRFEVIKEIKYGYVVYKPFFWVEENTKGTTPTHNGIGYKVLKEILKPEKLNSISLTPCPNGSNWDSIFRELEEKKFDIIIAPLFETRTRLFDFNVTFCSPLFYSNIGLYIKKSDETSCLENKFTFNEAIEYIKKQINEKGWQGNYLKSELSDSLMKKYELKSIEVKQTNPTSDEDFRTIIGNIASGHKQKEDFTFMEVFKAESIIDQTTQVINILKNNELLYPVSFVVRKQDTVLKNLINLRLMEMESSVNKDSSDNNISELENIIKNVAITDPIKIDESKFKNIFIRKYDFTKLVTL